MSNKKSKDQTSGQLPRESNRDIFVADFLIITLQKYMGTERKDFTLYEKFEDMGLDSLDIVEITLDAEDQFDINISDEEMFGWKDISGVLETLNQKLDEMGVVY